MSDKKKDNKMYNTFIKDLLGPDFDKNLLSEQDKKAIEFIPSEDEILVLAYDKFGNSQEAIDISSDFDSIDKLALGRAIAILNGYTFDLTKPQADEVHSAYEEYNKILNRLS